MIKVEPGAQQIDAFQESRNLLLTKTAHADSIPGLEILANDVRCTHAAAIAQIDLEQLFYLRSRGLPLEKAKRLVIEGFLEATVERFEQGFVREAIAGALERRLEARPRLATRPPWRRAGIPGHVGAAATVAAGSWARPACRTVARVRPAGARRARSSR